MAYLIGLVMACFGFLQTANAASFEGKTEFIAQPVYGQLTVSCQGHTGIGVGLAQCEDVILEPSEAAYFNAEKGTSADTLKLTSLRSDGKTIKKTERYNPTTGQSTSRVNLWIETLFQTALLGEGKNVVSYELTKFGQVQASGEFEVVVTAMPARQCEPGHEWSNMPSDCDSPTFLCRQYFWRQNYCK